MIVSLVRQKITKIQRITLGVLVIIEVHAKDVVCELFKNKITDVNEFEWLA